VKESVSVIGTGLMGTAFTERLLAAGYPVYVYNRTRANADPLLQLGAQWSDRPLAQSARIIFAVYTAEVVDHMLLDMQADLQPNHTIIDTATSDPQQTAALGSRLAGQGGESEDGIAYLEAPFSGSSEQTRRGEAMTMVSGSAEVFEACRDLWDCLAAKTFYVGPWGNAARMKLLTNLVLGLNRATLAEGLVFAQRVGLDKSAALNVLIASAGYSRVMDTKGQKMLRGDFTPQARLSQHLKDIRLVLQEADRGGAKLPLSSLHLELLEQAEKSGLGELDNSAILRLIESIADQEP
jgi:3-hydroxyisobutyrate dehydrogenase-like beta-hydroxyacid dehydrogenase